MNTAVKDFDGKVVENPHTILVRRASPFRTYRFKAGYTDRARAEQYALYLFPMIKHVLQNAYENQLTIKGSKKYAATFFDGFNAA